MNVFINALGITCALGDGAASTSLALAASAAASAAASPNSFNGALRKKKDAYAKSNGKLSLP